MGRRRGLSSGGQQHGDERPLHVSRARSLSIPRPANKDELKRAMRASYIILNAWSKTILSIQEETTKKIHSINDYEYPVEGICRLVNLYNEAMAGKRNPNEPIFAFMERFRYQAQ